jgi:hypothetical protein
MANSISLAEKFLPILDGVYKRESLTARLLGANALIRFDGANKVSIFKTSLDGLADYSRANGFVNGSVTAGWESYTLSKDRGVGLSVDRMDNEETLGMAFGTLAGEFARVNEVPELDAYRFAKMASANGITSASAAITVGTTDVPALIDTAEQVMGDAEVPTEGRILFVSEKAYAGLKSKITRYLRNEGDVNRNVEMYNDMEVVRVPKGRFNTAVTLYDGTANFGFAPTAGGYPINFLIVHPSAVLPIVKHEIVKVFSPDENQTADAWKFQIRIYHDLFVLDQKVKGIYCHYDTTANT